MLSPRIKAISSWFFKNSDALVFDRTPSHYSHPLTRQKFLSPSRSSPWCLSIYHLWSNFSYSLATLSTAFELYEGPSSPVGFSVMTSCWSLSFDFSYVSVSCISPSKLVFPSLKVGNGSLVLAVERLVSVTIVRRNYHSDFCMLSIHGFYFFYPRWF